MKGIGEVFNFSSPIDNGGIAFPAVILHMEQKCGHSAT